MEENITENNETKNVDQLLAMLGDIIQDAWTVPLSGGKCLLERERAMEVIEEIRVTLPDDLRQAKSIVESRREIVETARSEADTLQKNARERAQQLINGDAIAVAAERKSKEILAEANARAAAVVAEAQAKARETVASAEAKTAELRKSTGDYLETTMQKSVEAMTLTLSEFRKIQQQIRSMSGKL